MKKNNTKKIYNPLEEIKYYSNSMNHSSYLELKEAYLRLAYLFTVEFSNLKLLETYIDKILGPQFIPNTINNTQEGRVLCMIDLNNGKPEEKEAIIRNLCNYILRRWYS